jgi:hypothetical protein
MRSLKSFQSISDNDSLGKSSPRLRLSSIGCLILDIRKKMIGRKVYLDQAELTHFVERVSNESNRFACQIEMDLGGIKVLGA